MFYIVFANKRDRTVFPADDDRQLKARLQPGIQHAALDVCSC
uniref:Uncharacterized protein n=1 Tax=Faecalibaculum rodentium TaxID=1702221 RepID=A0A140DXR5_9FIRM|nr:hypothetical protein AALO17_23080 [Faecalibaculum rodentium]